MGVEIASSTPRSTIVRKLLAPLGSGFKKGAAWIRGRQRPREPYGLPSTKPDQDALKEALHQVPVFVDVRVVVALVDARERRDALAVSYAERPFAARSFQVRSAALACEALQPGLTVFGFTASLAELAWPGLGAAILYTPKTALTLILSSA